MNRKNASSKGLARKSNKSVVGRNKTRKAHSKSQTKKSQRRRDIKNA